MSEDKPRDRLFATPLQELGAFVFDESVAQVFPDMINRSVPGYGTVIGLTGVIAARHAQENSRIYDLGCSLGASCMSVRHRVQAANCTLVGVDNSAAMIERCRQNIESDSALMETELRCEDIDQTEISNASVVILNFTLQFIPPPRRAALLQRIHDGLRPGGALILSEKIRFTDPPLEQCFTDLHYDFKKANGYSSLEISQKRTALENVLFPETLGEHRQRLQQCGFGFVEQWFACLNFISLLAVK